MEKEKSTKGQSGEAVLHDPEPIPFGETGFKALFENAPIGIFQTTSKGEVRYVNASMADLVAAGSPQEAAARYSDLSLQLYADPGRREEFIQQLTQAGEVVGFEYEAVRLDGEHRWFSMSARISERCADGSVVIDGFTADITSIKKMELALRESEQRHRLMADNALDAIWQMDLGLRFIYVNPSVFQILGYRPEEFVGTCLSDHCSPESMHSMSTIIFKELEHPETHTGVLFQTQLRHKGGHLVPVEINGRLLFNESGEVIGLQGSTRDICERSEQQKRLAESEARFRSAFDNSYFGRTMTLPDGRLNRVNKALCQMLGYDAQALEKMKFADITHPDDLAASHELVKCLLDGQSSVRRMQKRYLHADGHTIWADVGVILIRDEKGRPVHFLTEMVDITEQKQAEEKSIELEQQLNQAQKMEAVGRLAGGVAHDFNNLLSIILGYAETMLEEIPSGHPLGESLKEVFDAGNRARELTRQLLAFSRKQALELVHGDINAVVTGFDKLLRRVIGEDIDLKIVLSPRPLFVKCDVSQIEQVLMNLAVNARDAMPQGGCLTVETSRVLLGDSRGSREINSAPAPFARIVVSDTGTGMDRDTLQRIFEPFFTTKDKDHGTGLGLATSYGIVHQHGGTIEAFSRPGQGTRFTILLPMVEEGPVQEKAASGVQARGSVAATILIVEDDPSVRKLAINILNRKGYRVIGSENVHEALALAAQQSQPIDLLLTDVVMPGMMGPEVFKKVAALHPNLKVLYISGYTYNILAQHGVPEDDRQLLPKPFSIKALVDKVEAVLNSA